jgi:hypothetical protein
MKWLTKSGIVLCIWVLSPLLLAQNLDHNINYFLQGRSVGSWELSLQFGQVKLDGNSGKTAKGSLVIEPTSRNTENDAVGLTWRPKGIKTEWGSVDANVMTMNLINTKGAIDLSSVKMDAALAFDIKVIKGPKEFVTLAMESNWDWKTRSEFPLKQVLNRLPDDKWLTIPIPLQCFDNGKLDFKKLTTIFMLQTTGKMQIELGDIRLTAYPADKVNCPT